jgi:hypothetical protein
LVGSFRGQLQLSSFLLLYWILELEYQGMLSSILYAKWWQGGGWCNNVTTCLQRMHTRLGSSKEMAKQVAFSGILSDAPGYNPGNLNLRTWLIDGGQMFPAMF